VVNARLRPEVINPKRRRPAKPVKLQREKDVQRSSVRETRVSKVKRLKTERTRTNPSYPRAGRTPAIHPLNLLSLGLVLIRASSSMQLLIMACSCQN
jgi:hypothetical protein